MGGATNFRSKPFGMFYVGSNWFVGARCSACCKRSSRSGKKWAALVWSATTGPQCRTGCRRHCDKAYFTDPDYLRRLDVEIMPAAPSTG